MALDFLILYEHVVREYESLLLLQAELQRRGYTVELRQLLDRKKLKYFSWKKPRVLVASNLYDNEGLNSHVYNNVGRCQRVVNLHWEQMLSDTQEAGDWFNFSGNAKRCVQTCWGPRTRDRLIAHGLPPQNAPVTGALMMDFLRPEFAGYYLDKAALCSRYGLRADRRLLVYISSFGYASMGRQEVEELSRMAGQDFTGFARVNRESMAATLDWFDRYLAAHPDEQLVYRRHPSEWDSPALAALEKNHPGFRVIFEDSVRQWIVAADEILLWMSSAAAEVYFAGKSCHILRPQPIPHEFDPVIYQGGRFVTDYEGFAAALAGPRGPFPLDEGLLRGYFDADPKMPAYRRMADLLEQVYREPPRDAPFGPGFRPHFNWLKLFALAGVHALDALRLDPARLFFFCPPLARFSGRIYGYIQKAKVPPAQAAAWRQKIEAIVEREGQG